MADILTQALFGSQWSPIETPWGIGASAIAQGVPQLINPQGSSRANAIKAIGGTLLAGLMGHFAQSQADERNAGLFGAMQEYQTATPERRQQIVAETPRFSNIAMALAGQQNQLLQDRALQEAKIRAEVLGEQLKAPYQAQAAGMKKRAELDAEMSIGGFASPVEKATDTLRSEFEEKAEVQEFMRVEKAASAISGALQDKGSVSDQELVRYSILMIEPGMAVREGEQNAIAASASIPAEWRGKLQKALAGETQLEPQVREGIKRLAMRAYDSHATTYNKSLGFYRGEANKKGIDPLRVGRLGEARPAKDIFNFSLTPPPSPGSAPTPAMPKPGETYKLPDGRTVRIVPRQ